MLTEPVHALKITIINSNDLNIQNSYIVFLASQKNINIYFFFKMSNKNAKEGRSNYVFKYEIKLKFGFI